MSNQTELPSLDIPKDEVAPLPSIPNTTPTVSVTPTNPTNPPPETNPSPRSGTGLLNKRKSSVINVLHSTPRWKQIVSATIGDKSATQSLMVLLTIFFNLDIIE